MMSGDHRRYELRCLSQGHKHRASRFSYRDHAMRRAYISFAKGCHILVLEHHYTDDEWEFHTDELTVIYDSTRATQT